MSEENSNQLRTTIGKIRDLCVEALDLLDSPTDVAKVSEVVAEIKQERPVPEPVFENAAPVNVVGGQPVGQSTNEDKQ
jgi:hypothetical protein